MVDVIFGYRSQGVATTFTTTLPSVPRTGEIVMHEGVTRTVTTVVWDTVTKSVVIRLRDLKENL